MNFTLCEICKKPLSMGNLCPDCLMIKQEMQKYVDEHADAKVAELSKKFGVSESLLRKWVKNGVFNCLVECKFCGHLIRVGTLCSGCKMGIVEELKKDGVQIKYTGKMHRLERKR